MLLLFAGAAGCQNGSLLFINGVAAHNESGQVGIDKTESVLSRPKAKVKKRNGVKNGLQAVKKAIYAGTERDKTFIILAWKSKVTRLSCGNNLLGTRDIFFRALACQGPTWFMKIYSAVLIVASSTNTETPNRSSTEEMTPEKVMAAPLFIARAVSSSTEM